LEHIKSLRAEQAEDHEGQFRWTLQVADRRLQHDLSTTADRKTEDARADCRESQAAERLFIGQLQTRQGGAFQLFIFVAFAHLRTNGVNDVSGLQVSAGRQDCSTHGRAPDLIALQLYFGSALSPNGASDTRAQHELRVGCVDDGVGVLLGNITLDEPDLSVPDSDVHRAGCYGKFNSGSKTKLFQRGRIGSLACRLRPAVAWRSFVMLLLRLSVCFPVSISLLLLLLVPRRAAAAHSVVPGIEVLLTEQLPLIQGKRVGLITNHTGVDRRLRHDIDLLASRAGVKLIALFSPEHGIRGTARAGEKVQSGVDEATGIPVFSLYGEVRHPTVEMLKNVDVLVYDIQDVGSRFYTFISTLGNCMESAAELKIPFVVLDRPNPLGGESLEGPLLDSNFQSFVGAYRIPIRYGLTTGELAGLIKSSRKLDLKLSVVKMRHWSRLQWYDTTGLIWVPPSPNIPTPQSALVYPGMCLVEGTNLSEGRGTTQPFEIVGAPWIDGLKLAKKLNAMGLRGVLFRPVAFAPTVSKFSGQVCQGVQLHLVDRDAFRPVFTAVSILREICQNYPEQFQFRMEHFDRLAGNDSLRKGLQEGLSAEAITSAWQADLKKFETDRKKFLLYP